MDKYNASNTDRSGPAGKAWKVIPSDPTDYVIATWLLECPGQSAVWNRYCLSVVHLRDEPGEPVPAVKQYDEAEYEMSVWALDPEQDDGWPFMFLTPGNYVAQFHGVTDARAVEIAGLAVNCFLSGDLPVEPHLVAHRRVFEQLLQNTPLHDRIGHQRHPELN